MVVQVKQREDEINEKASEEHQRLSKELFTARERAAEQHRQHVLEMESVTQQNSQLQQELSETAHAGRALREQLDALKIELADAQRQSADVRKDADIYRIC